MRRPTKPPRPPRPGSRTGTRTTSAGPGRKAGPTGKPGRSDRGRSAPPGGKSRVDRGTGAAGARAPRKARPKPAPAAAQAPAPAARRTPDGSASRKSRPEKAKGIWLYGRHAVEAALRNPRRSCHRLLGTPEALERLPAELRRSGVEVQEVERDELDRRLGADALHQGLALSVAPLPTLDLKRATQPEAGPNLVLVLDQIQDPHNLGAILRSAAAFGARAVIVPDRHSAPLGAVTARAAAGALDLVPVVEVTNLARALETLKDQGYWRVVLDGGAEAGIEATPDTQNLVLVLGAEGTGVRRLVRERADLAVRLPIAPAMESLNVSVACGIALYALASRARSD